MPKRSLGQNFLINTHIVDNIIHFSGLRINETVLEIGPGKGALTKKLAETAGRVVAIEKDNALAEDLKLGFKNHRNVEIIGADILESDMKSIVPKGALMIANLPYNIATVIITSLLNFPSHFSSITVMVQKEVGERICARPGTKPYSALSVLMASCFDTVTGPVIGPDNFFPRPKVDSILIRLIPKDDPITPETLAPLKKVVFHTFNSRRKMLRNSLSNLPGMTPETLNNIEKKTGIDFSRRPQDLDLLEFIQLTRLYVETVVR
ncbi:MAG TPA: 16S rRNA (adenine(1518)-N(6)/adenine(1519)-N(6))-dimethyltransferase RsmA [Desulfomonilia bacterium]